MRRPLTVTIIGWFFIVAGTVGFAYHFSEVDIENPFSNDAVAVLFVRLLAICGGILALRGSNVGRWLLVAWLAYHVVLSYFHATSGLVPHAVLLAVVVYILFRRHANDFFSSPKSAHREHS